MPSVSILQAIDTYNDLLTALHYAYWDAREMEHKDIIFDIVTILHSELGELSKLSVNDHSMNYEPITEELPGCCRKFSALQKNLHDWFPRTKTAKQLESSLIAAAALVSEICLI